MSHCPQLVSQISQSKSEGTPGEVRIYGDIVVVAIAYFENIFNPPTYRFIVLSIKTGSQISICPELPEVWCISFLALRCETNLQKAFQPCSFQALPAPHGDRRDETSRTARRPYL